MFNRIRAIAVPVSVALAVVALTACGGGSTRASLSGDTVARVGNSAITTAEINHWMSTLLGGDFYETIQLTAPRGLVSEPASYGRCVAQLKVIVGKSSPAELAKRCHQLYELLRRQTIEYLINSYGEIEEAAEVGVKANRHEVEESFDQLKARDFPREAEMQHYLSSRDWSLADELFLVKRNILGPKMLAKVERKLGTGGEAAVEKFYKEDAAKLTAETTCRAGYVVEGCSEYKPSAAAPGSPGSPDLLIEALGVVRPSATSAPDLECNSNPAARIGPKLSCEPTSQNR